MPLHEETPFERHVRLMRAHQERIRGEQTREQMIAGEESGEDVPIAERFTTLRGHHRRRDEVVMVRQRDQEFTAVLRDGTLVQVDDATGRALRTEVSARQRHRAAALGEMVPSDEFTDARPVLEDRLREMQQRFAAGMAIPSVQRAFEQFGEAAQTAERRAAETAIRLTDAGAVERLADLMADTTEERHTLLGTATLADGSTARVYRDGSSPLTPAVSSLDCNEVTASPSHEVTAMYRPWQDRFFGVEMEMNQVTTSNTALPLSSLVRAVTDAATHPVDGRGVWHGSAGAVWDIKTDSSAGHVDGAYGWEVASPKLKLDASANNEELKAVCHAIARLAPRVNRKCGLHVTVDVSDFSWRDMRNLLVLWARYEPFVFELCPQTRRANQYCPPLRKTRWMDSNARSWATVERAIGETTDRGFGSSLAGFPRGSLNMAHWVTGKRIEFRLQAGTVNYEKIRRWTQFLLAFVARAKQGAPFPMIQSGGWSDKGFSTGYVFKMLGLAASKFCPNVPAESTELMAWADARRQQFKEDAIARAAVAHAGTF
jgi:hypothetical protein